MREIDRRTQFSRRALLRTGAAAVPAAIVGGVSISADAAWAQDAKGTAPHAMATLVKVARDIYPHDRVADSYYITAVSGYDSGKPEVRDLMTKGCAILDADAKKKFGTAYLLVAE